MSAELIPNPDQNYFADPALDFAAQQAKLERRRKLAESLVANAMQSNGNSGMAGQVYMVGNQWGNVAQNLGGSVLSALNDRDQADLSAKDSAARQEFLKANGMENLAAADNTSLRGVIEKQVGQQLDYPRQREVEAAKQAIENARIEAQDKRQAALFAQQGELLDKRLAGQKDLKQLPSIVIHQGGGRPDADLDRELKQARIDAIRNPKPVASERKAALAQDDLISKVDNALAELERNPDAVGMRTLVPNIALQRLDPQGVSARAALSELGAEKAHELYGASFTAAERARADQFIPAAGDDLPTVKKKLANMRKLAEQAKARVAGQQPPAEKKRIKFSELP